jgi:hypothetical protein
MKLPEGFDLVHSEKQQLRAVVINGDEVRTLLRAAADSIADGFKMEGERDGFIIAVEIKGRHFRIEVSARLFTITLNPCGRG